MKNPFDIPCVIFAGGKSSRMGSDKALLPFGGFSSLAEFQYHRLSKLFETVYISTKENKFDFTVPLLLDPPTQGLYAPTAGFVSMFQQIEDETIFVISVDTPFVSEAEIKTLLEVYTDEDTVVATTVQGTHPMCGLYNRRLLPQFEKMLTQDDHRLGKLLKNVKTTYVKFEDEAPFKNLNHPQEYQEALKLL